MIEVREEAKETRRERQMKRDKKQTTRFATDVSELYGIPYNVGGSLYPRILLVF